jgi:hypothetical protein
MTWRGDRSFKLSGWTGTNCPFHLKSRFSQEPGSVMLLDTRSRGPNHSKRVAVESVPACAFILCTQALASVTSTAWNDYNFQTGSHLSGRVFKEYVHLCNPVLSSFETFRSSDTLLQNCNENLHRPKTRGRPVLTFLAHGEEHARIRLQRVADHFSSTSAAARG